ncbi:MAG: Stp1/IreP family PP2C-type Ser/Thr phosphatase [Clostridia bacterium]|nr:Stp1/IreP family PP2C-type Ser/Thr phosphatase [Clostridia bacterium]
MRVYAKSDIGKVRNMNQDSFSVPVDNVELKLYILADGMGGYKGGEIASRVAVTATEKYIKEKFYLLEKRDKKSIMKVIEDAIEFANTAIYEESEQDEELQDMGTTIEVCLIYKNKVYIGHIGDSRIYQIRNNIMERVTTDHSYVEKLVRDGEITREESYTHPKKNLLIKALGTDEKAEPDLLDISIQKDDVLLICSDGLTNMIKEDRILEIVNENIETAIDNLIEEANENGGLDNITVIIISNK